jgi:3-dehydroquinate dehydratase-2
MAAATKRVLLLNGPNLNLLGEREPAVYGTATLADQVAAATQAASEVGLVVDSLQSNSSSELVDAIQSARKTHDAIVINPGAFTHYAWSIHDALATFSGPVIEVHISNPSSRESWRHESVVAPVASGTIAGFGGIGYVLAVQAVARILSAK